MSKLFRGSFVSSILVLLMATSTAHIHAQSQGVTVSDQDEADVLESLLQLATEPLGWDFGNTRRFSSENIRSLSASRLKQHGFTLVQPSDIERGKRDNVIEYVVIRSMYSKDTIVVVRLSVVKEGRPCFAPSFFTQSNFTYYFKKSEGQWVGRLVRGPSPFPFSKSLATPPQPSRLIY